VTTWDGGEPQIEVWRQGHPHAPFDCACSVNSDVADGGCLLSISGGALAAPTGRTLNSGTWTGEGCLPKTCVVLAGNDQWPPQCGVP
jgi:hypothetical protein